MDPVNIFLIDPEHRAILPAVMHLNPERRPRPCKGYSDPILLDRRYFAAGHDHWKRPPTALYV